MAIASRLQHVYIFTVKQVDTHNEHGMLRLLADSCLQASSKLCYIALSSSLTHISNLNRTAESDLVLGLYNSQSQQL